MSVSTHQAFQEVYGPVIVSCKRGLSATPPSNHYRYGHRDGARAYHSDLQNSSGIKQRLVEVSQVHAVTVQPVSNIRYFSAHCCNRQQTKSANMDQLALHRIAGRLKSMHCSSISVQNALLCRRYCQ